VEGGKVHLSLHAGQIEAWQSTARYTYILAGAQSGKTTYLPWIGARNIAQTCDPAGGSNDFLAVTATYDLFRLKFLPAMQEVFENALGIGRYWGSDRVIELRDPRTGEFWAKRSSDPMWGRIILRAASSPAGLESSTGRGAILDEYGQDSFTAEVMEALDRRLSLIGGWIVGGTTPYTAFGWIRDRVVIPYERIGTALEQAGDRDVCLIRFDSCTNPAFSPEEFERARRSMPAWRFDLFYRGVLSRPAGQIFSCFKDRDVRDGGHRCKPFPVPTTWLRAVGPDFGTTNTAAVVGAIEEDREGYPTGRVVLFATYSGSGRHASEHAEAIKTQAAGPIVYAVGGAPSEDGWRAGYLWAGLPVHPPTERDVEVRIDRVFGAIKTGKVLIFDTLRGGGSKPGLIDQIMDYSRELDASGNVTEKIRNKSKYHFVDAGGYLLVGLAALTGMAKRFLPFEPRRHWKNLPGKTLDIKCEPWWPRYGGLKYSPSGASAFVLATADPTGALHVEGEVIRSGASVEEMASAIKALIKARRGDEVNTAVPIVASAEMFADAPTQGGGLVGESPANAFLRAGLSLVPADGDGVTEWSELRERLEASGARSLSVDRSACPTLALTMLLIEPDGQEPASPAKNSPIEAAIALCYLLLLRPAPARKSAGASLIADLNKALGEQADPMRASETVDPEKVNPELMKLLGVKK
jgi:hypothetical protein